MEGYAVSEEKAVIENENLNSETFTPSVPEIPVEPGAEEASLENTAPKIEIVDEDEFFEEVDSPVQKAEAPESQPESQTAQAETSSTQTASSVTYDEEPSSRHFFHSRKADSISRDQLILSRISNKDLMEYLRLEEKRSERLQEAREKRNSRIMTAFMTTMSLAAVVGVVYLLKDNPAILVNILYIGGLLAAFWFWKKK